jgi:hypothetical protein
MKKNFLIGLLVLLPLVLGAVLGLINESIGALMFLYVGFAYIVVTLIILAVNIKNL